MNSQTLKNEVAVLHALLLRELKNRFGRFKLGYAWALLEPLGYVGAFSIIRIAFGSENLAGLSFPIFFTLGIIPFIFFTNSLMQTLSALKANSGLFNYRNIRPYHCVLARQILEFIIYFLSGILILFLFNLIGYGFELNNLLQVAWILLLFNILCLGLGFLMVVWGPLFRESEKILPILIRPMFLLSGIFLPLIHVPEKYMPYLDWNPVLHTIELLRFHLTTGYMTSIHSSGYLFVCSLSILIIGLLVYRWKERELLTSGAIRVR